MLKKSREAEEDKIIAGGAAPLGWKAAGLSELTRCGEAEENDEEKGGRGRKKRG